MVYVSYMSDPLQLAGSPLARVGSDLSETRCCNCEALADKISWASKWTERRDQEYDLGLPCGRRSCRPLGSHRITRPNTAGGTRV
jgi:hypothetical protein